MIGKLVTTMSSRCEIPVLFFVSEEIAECARCKLSES